MVDLSITPVMERSSVGNGSGDKEDTLTRDIRSLARNSNITITPSQPNASALGKGRYDNAITVDFNFPFLI